MMPRAPTVRGFQGRNSSSPIASAACSAGDGVQGGAGRGRQQSVGVQNTGMHSRTRQSHPESCSPRNPAAAAAAANHPPTWKQACTRVRRRLLISGRALSSRAWYSSPPSPARRAAKSAAHARHESGRHAKAGQDARVSQAVVQQAAGQPAGMHQRARQACGSNAHPPDSSFSSSTMVHRLPPNQPYRDVFCARSARLLLFSRPACSSKAGGRGAGGGQRHQQQRELNSGGLRASFSSRSAGNIDNHAVLQPCPPAAPTPRGRRQSRCS